MTTHSAECYKWHHECAVAEVERRRSSAARRLQLAQTLQDRLDEAREQRDALLEVLKLARSIIGHPDDAHTQMIDAAIKAVEGEKT